LPIALLSGAFFVAFLNLLIIAVCVTELRLTPHRQVHKNNKQKPTFKIIQFNKFFDNKNLEEIHQEIIDSDANIVVLQEADNNFAKKAKEIKSQYSHMFTDANDHPYGLMIFSKYPFLEEEKFPIKNTYEKSDGYRVVVHPEGFKDPIAIFSVHATNAFPKMSWEQRNALLYSASKEIKKYNAKHKIFTGDWNITPYSPIFKSVCEKTKLDVAYNYLIPAPSWPYIPQIPHALSKLFQIPIDHILFSKNLIAVRKKIGKALGSDHHMLEMDFIEK
jgi:endonuclease/exonuclease/phosphatase (EEP) superfamily protein YafD